MSNFLPFNNYGIHDRAGETVFVTEEDVLTSIVISGYSVKFPSTDAFYVLHTYATWPKHMCERGCRTKPRCIAQLLDELSSIKLPPTLKVILNSSSPHVNQLKSAGYGLPSASYDTQLCLATVGDLCNAIASQPGARLENRFAQHYHDNVLTFWYEWKA